MTALVFCNFYLAPHLSQFLLDHHEQLYLLGYNNFVIQSDEGKEAQSIINYKKELLLAFNNIKETYYKIIGTAFKSSLQAQIIMLEEIYNFGYALHSTHPNDFSDSLPNLIATAQKTIIYIGLDHCINVAKNFPDMQETIFLYSSDSCKLEEALFPDQKSNSCSDIDNLHDSHFRSVENLDLLNILGDTHINDEL